MWNAWIPRGVIINVDCDQVLVDATNVQGTRVGENGNRKRRGGEGECSLQTDGRRITITASFSTCNDECDWSTTNNGRPLVRFAKCALKPFLLTGQEQRGPAPPETKITKNIFVKMEVDIAADWQTHRRRIK